MGQQDPPSLTSPVAPVAAVGADANSTTSTPAAPPPEDFYVLWGEDRLNLTLFLERHPAGPDILLPYRNRDIRKAFEEVGHSSAAQRMVEKFRLDAADLTKQTTSADTKSKSLKLELTPDVVDWTFVKQKLFTSEDRMFVHKVLGLACLISYFYRYFYLWPVTGSLGLDEFSYFNLATMMLHWLLSSSSLIFHVLSRRNVKEPLIIYEEYRLHAILFTTRAIGVTFIAWWGHLTGISTGVLIGLFLLAVHGSVDLVTAKFGTKGVTAVRNNGRGQWYLKYLRMFYSYYQFLAIASHLLVSSNLGSMGFNTLVAIQSSAFLMTLRRKNLVVWQTHMFWYSLALFVSMGFIWQVHGPLFYVACAICFFVRCQFNVSKYAIWSTFVAVYPLAVSRLHALHPLSHLESS
jgi:hypothetical protein